jgi:Asp-tRNA(Asn)/Glu-tRNA(Gln) amidotransferase B subunit
VTQQAAAPKQRSIRLGKYSIEPGSHPDLEKLMLRVRNEISQLRAAQGDQKVFNKRIVDFFAEYLYETVSALTVTNVVHEAGLIDMNDQIQELHGRIEGEGLDIEDAQIIMTALTKLVAVVKSITPSDAETKSVIDDALSTANEALEIVQPYTELDEDDGEDGEDGEDD